MAKIKEILEKLNNDFPEYLQYLKEKEEYEANMDLIAIIKRFPIKKEPPQPTYEYKVPSLYTTVITRRHS